MQTVTGRWTVWKALGSLNGQELNDPFLPFSGLEFIDLLLSSYPYINSEDLSLSAIGRSASITSGRIDVTDNNPKTQDSSRRVCGRLNLTRRLLLELDNGDILAGRTMDIV